jgi:predicted amidophosphoribosyltransferase
MFHQNSDAGKALTELDSTECPHCKRSKRSGHSFCWNCFKELPQRLKNLLYKKFWEGYVEYYDEAKEWLKENNI